MHLARTFLSLACRHRSAATSIRTSTTHWMSSSAAASSSIDFAKDALIHADAVCFDVDSTVIGEEGIDVLADFLGQHETVAALTTAAMQGGLPFDQALQQRLDVLQPRRQDILDCVAQHPAPLTPHVASLMQQLQQRNTHVYLVSGGFRLMIEPVAARLQIPKDRIVANTILFDDSGNYNGFDVTEPTSQDMGKPAALQHLKDTHGYQTMVMIGDGATDAQAKPPATAFIGFGGVAVRTAVQEAADWFVTDFQEVVEVLNTAPPRKSSS